MKSSVTDSCWNVTRGVMTKSCGRDELCAEIPPGRCMADDFRKIPASEPRVSKRLYFS